MARAILGIGAALWLISGAAGMLLAALGVEGLERALPPLAIDAEALRGAVTAVSAGLLTLGAVHLAILLGLRRRSRWSQTAGILLAGLLAALCLALVAAAVTSAAVNPAVAPILLLAAGGAAVGALGYGLAAARLVLARRTGRAT
jgi:hypothetical protein